jgi:carbon-monoxide dehydrogenase medium subunit
LRAAGVGGICSFYGAGAMKPPEFDYCRPADLDEAVGLLARHGEAAKLLAGGQSLVPLLNFRMLRPRLLIDLNRLKELDFVAETADGLRIGALTRHRTLETSPLVARHFPAIAEATTQIAHLAIRNRGTLGGSLAHADPAAELPLLVLLLDGAIHTRSAAGARLHAAHDFFVAPLTTALADDEIVTEIALPFLMPQTGSAFVEMALRHGDFAIAAVAATVTLKDGRIAQARLAAAGVGETPQRLSAAEASLLDEPLSPASIEQAARQASAEVEPGSDLRGSADYRRHLVAVLAEQALTVAGARCR